MKKLTQTTLLCLAICATSLCSGQNADFIRGDCNTDGSTDFVIGDIVALSNYLVSGSSCGVTCLDACDANNDGSIDAADVAFMINLGLACSSPYLPQPWPLCGQDPVTPPGSLGCNTYPCSLNLPSPSGGILSFRVPLESCGVVDDTITIEVQLKIGGDLTNNVFTPYEVSALSYGLSHDPTHLELLNVTSVPLPAGSLEYHTLLPSQGFFSEVGFPGAVAGTNPATYFTIAYVDYLVLDTGSSPLNFVTSIGPCMRPIAVYSSTSSTIFSCTEVPGVRNGMVNTGIYSFIRGDTNADGACNIADVINLLGYIFSSGGNCQCMDACDVNDDGQVNIADAISKLGFLFSNSSPPPAPYPDCCLDQTFDTLDCVSFPPCP